MSPLVSIVIPVHNAAPWLAETLDSALAQTCREREVIVIDDGSTDDSPAIAEAYARRHRDIQLVTQENRGASAARNRGLRQASGRYIQFLDADDLLAPDKIVRQVEVLERAGPDRLASARWGRFEGVPATARFVDDAVFRDFAPVDFLRTVLQANLMMHPSAWLVPRRLAERAGPWDESLSLNDDGEYFARVVLASAGIHFVAAASAFYRSGFRGSLSQRRDPAAVHSQFRALERIEHHLRARTDAADVRQALAAAWQRFLYEYHPLPPALARAATAAVRANGGANQPPPWGPRSLRLARFLGWRLVARLRRLRFTPR